MNELLRRLLYLPVQASTAARGIDTLHYTVIGATMLGATAVFLIALAMLARYRRRPGDPALTSRFKMPLAVEAALIAGTTALFLAWWVVGYRQYVSMREPPADAIDVFVTGSQWVWKFAYPGGRGSVGVLAVPVGRPVRLLITSRDVIHSFYVPAFRVKQDAVPGRYVTAWFEANRTGSFDVLCAEFCGLSHSRMRATVLVLSPAEYARWVERAARRDDDDPASALEDPAANLVEVGRRVAARSGCLACHTVDGQRHIGPTWRMLYGSRVTLRDGREVVADEAYLTRSMMDPAADVTAGFDPVMPTFRGVIDAPDVAALVEYIKSLRTPVAPLATLPAVRPVTDSGAR